MPAVVELKEPPDGGRLEILLETGVVLAGLVTDVEGKGVPGALVGVGRASTAFARQPRMELSNSHPWPGPARLTCSKRERMAILTGR